MTLGAGPDRAGRCFTGRAGPPDVPGLQPKPGTGYRAVPCLGRAKKNEFLGGLSGRGLSGQL